MKGRRTGREVEGELAEEKDGHRHDSNDLRSTSSSHFLGLGSRDNHPRIGVQRQTGMASFVDHTVLNASVQRL